MDPSLNPDGVEFIDYGLGGVVGFSDENGKFRVPTLRNIKNTSPYMHNGVFNTLIDVVHFYNNRDRDQVPAEVAENVSRLGRIGNLGLNSNEESDLVEFLETLSDGYF
ncbi:MAG: hypothetical protein HQL49_12985 [Gammaproteobacteria bacterium]|nr:hypothetical protein [Gammaproteobacteria bacterium]